MPSNICFWRPSNTTIHYEATTVVTFRVLYSKTYTFEIHIQFKRVNFFRSVNGLCAKFKSVLISINVVSKLFQTYFSSFYGSQLWNLSSSSFNDICTAWNKAVHRIFHLSFTTHRCLPSCVNQLDHIRDNLIKRSTPLFQNMMLSDNEVIKFLSVNAYFCNSSVGLNRKFFNMYKKKL